MIFNKPIERFSEMEEIQIEKKRKVSLNYLYDYKKDLEEQDEGESVEYLQTLHRIQAINIAFEVDKLERLTTRNINPFKFLTWRKLMKEKENLKRILLDTIIDGYNDFNET